MRLTFILGTLVCLLGASAQVPYRVIVPVGDLEPGTMLYMINYDTSERIDSVRVDDEKAVFTGDIDDPIMVRIVAENNKRYGTLILEQGTCAINQQSKMGVGTMLNDQLRNYVDRLDAIGDSIDHVESEDEFNRLLSLYLGIERQGVLDNPDSPIGYFLFIDYAGVSEPEDIISLIEAVPSLRDYKRVQAMEQALQRRMATQPGQPFADFAVTYDGVTRRLSDYVGRGQYVLVDFWASWCGPCMREIETLREIYNQYGDRLKVLGVAVWDRPEDTIAAIQRKNIPWECIIDAQHIPTDIYGIQGIPCIILFGPDGRIISRDLQGQMLKDAVSAALD